MKALMRLFLLALLAMSTSACTIHHYVEQDYPQYLVNNTGTANLPTTDRVSAYLLAPATQQHSYEFRSMMSGYGNLWIVEFGRMLDDTMNSADARKAFGAIQKVSEVSGASDGLLLFDLQNYSFEEFGAHISLQISLYRSGKVVFSKLYRQDGKTQGGKMFWGGVFAQKNAVQQSTKLALDEILRQLIADLNNLPK